MNTDIGVDTKKATLQGVVFPLHTDAQAALQQYRSKRLNYVQLVSSTATLILRCLSFILLLLCFEIFCARTVYRLWPDHSKSFFSTAEIQWVHVTWWDQRSRQRLIVEPRPLFVCCPESFSRRTRCFCRPTVITSMWRLSLCGSCKCFCQYESPLFLLLINFNFSFYTDKHWCYNLSHRVGDY